MNFLMRDVTFQDSEILLDWRNESKVRMYSRNSDLITKEIHTHWLSQRLLIICDQPFWMFENSQERIGFVRFDFDVALQHYEISIVLNPALRGKGFGEVILKTSIENCLALRSDSTFFAEVHEDNPASHSLFLNCGFRKIGLDGNFLVLKRFANS